MKNTNDNLSEYANPELYDLENQNFEPDDLFLLDVAKKLNGPILEVVCGTGRITIPLAQNQVKLETTYRRWVDENGNEVLKVAPLSLRYTFPQEIKPYCITMDSILLSSLVTGSVAH